MREDGTIALPAPLQGTIIAIGAAVGKSVRAGDPILIMESMKMEHVIEAPFSGVLRSVHVAVGDTVFEGHTLAFFEPKVLAGADKRSEENVDLDFIRPDLAAVHERHRGVLDEKRPQAVERRRKTGQRVRQNVDDCSIQAQR